MKRVNNKYRNNNGNNQIYSLNYKFDSNSIAGKCSGTALDLIKRYNELAKDAASDNDYVTAEVFRQYAEHYRKIVTEINEKKNQNRQMNNQQNQNVTEQAEVSVAEDINSSAENGVNDNEVTTEEVVKVEKKETPKPEEKNYMPIYSQEELDELDAEEEEYEEDSYDYDEYDDDSYYE